MKYQEGRVKVWKSPISGHYIWSCMSNRCQVGYSEKYGHGPIWEVIQHDADAHARVNHHKPIPHDENRTPPNGVHKVEIFTNPPEVWREALEEHVTQQTGRADWQMRYMQ